MWKKIEVIHRILNRLLIMCITLSNTCGKLLFFPTENMLSTVLWITNKKLSTLSTWVFYRDTRFISIVYTPYFLDIHKLPTICGYLKSMWITLAFSVEKLWFKFFAQKKSSWCLVRRQIIFIFLDFNILLLYNRYDIF